MSSVESCVVKSYSAARTSKDAKVSSDVDVRSRFLTTFSLLRARSAEALDMGRQQKCCRACEDWEIQRAKLTTAVVSESCLLTPILLILGFQHPQLHSSSILLTECVRLGQSTRLMWQLQQSTDNTHVPQSNPKGKNCRPKIQLFLAVSYRA